MVERTLILFAPGAGAPSTCAWMRTWAARLATIGTVESFDYDYMRDHRRAPDPLPRLVEAHRAALAGARARHPEASRIVLAGKSMGSRMGCHLSLTERVTGLVCLRYPLQPARGGKVRSEVLERLRTPILFVQGTRDPLCPLDLLADVRARMAARSELYVVEGGDHSLEIPKRLAAFFSQAASDAAALVAIARFIEGLGQGAGAPEAGGGSSS